MKMLRLLVLLLSFMMLMISGCASDKLALMSTDQMPSLKGQSTKTVIDQLGQPSRKYTDSNRNQVWEYKTPASAQQGKNTFVKISSFGLFSGDSSVYVDVLRLTFHNDRVANYTYDENVLNISIPGMANSQISTPMPEATEPQPKVSANSKTKSISPIDDAIESNTLSTTSISGPVIVNVNKVKLRAKPSSKAAVVKTLKKGEEVQVVKFKDQWCLIELKGGETGWCLRDSLAPK